jgi:tetratricopeptide (TPR) repeat protein
MAQDRIWTAAAALVAVVSGSPGHAASKQEIYNQAQAAFDAENWIVAIRGFEQVLGPAGKDSPSQAIIRSRLAEAYLKNNQLSAARDAARLALARMDHSDSVAIASTWLTLGEALRYDLNMSDAIAAFEQVIAIAPADSALTFYAQLGLAKAAMVTKPAAAAAALDTILSNQSLLETAGKDKLAVIEDWRGRAELNLGNTKTAISYFEKAVHHSGGIDGKKVNIAQVMIRGDAAIAYKLANDDGRTREYLTLTNAGHLDWNGWGNAAVMQPPICGAGNDLRPTDTAVVEFSIGEDGHVIAAAPIYANRTGDAGVEFARAVRDWFWSPLVIAKLTPFWRASVRMQMRCLSRPAPAQLSESFRDATTQWLKSIGAENISAISHVPKASMAAASQGQGPQEPQLAEQGDLKSSITADGKTDPLDRLLDAYAAPADVRAYLIYDHHSGKNNNSVAQAKGRAAYLKTRLPDFESRWPGSRAAAWLRLEYAMALENGRDLDAAKPELERLIALPEGVIGSSDPIRIVATLHLSALTNHSGDKVGAEQLLVKSGLSAEQCSLVDVQPAAANAGFFSSDFPFEALRWHFEGYVREDYDITADGRVANLRTVLAYPPFIFEAGTERTIAKFKYIPPVINGQPVGCLGKTQNINFQIPNH